VEPSTISSDVTSVRPVEGPPSPAFELERFEYVHASPTNALLRLTGRATPESAALALVVDLGDRLERLAAIPSPGGAAGQWAFSAPAAVVTGSASWTVEVAGEGLPIPLPTERKGPPPTPESELARERVARRRAESEVTALRRRLADMELEVATHQAELEAAESRIRALRADSAVGREELEAELDAARGDLAVQREELGARANAAEGELATLRTGGTEPDFALPPEDWHAVESPERPIRPLTGRPKLVDS
jgi:hypothetical protein